MARLAGTTFGELDRHLGDKLARPIGNNTKVSRGIDGRLIIRLHGHHIVSLCRDGTVWANDAGWQTVTTKDRLNQFLPYPFRIVQKDYEWFVVNTRTGIRCQWLGSEYFGDRS